MPGTEPVGGRRFSLLRTLGEGSFGSVYLAEMEGAGGFRRRVALKLLNDSWGAGSDAARRLRDEARLLGRLDHRHIVRVDDLVQVNGRWALVMEYVSGADMERVFSWAEEAGTRLSPRAVAELGVAVATALDAAWNAPGEDDAPLHVVHRDIKPSNVRLAENGDVKVLDFGVARAAFAGREARTERVRYGSLGYMAPERLLGEPDTAAGDVYALGVMLYELLTTKLYGRAELGVDRQVAQVAAARAALVEALGESALVDLVARCLAYAPDDRPTAPAVAEALRALVPDLPGDDLVRFARDVLPRIAATPSQEGVRGTVLEESGPRTETGARVSSATLVYDPDEPEAPAPDPFAAEPAPEKRPPWAAVGIGLVAVLLVGIGGMFALRGGPADAPPADPVADAPAATASPADAVAAEAPAGSAADAALAAPSEAPPPEAPPDAAPTAPAVADGAPVDAPPPHRVPAAKKPASGTGAPAVAALAAPPEAAPPAAPAPRLRAAKFTVAGAEGIAVTCGDVTGSGATSTLLREFPAGECVVAAAGRTARVRLDSPRGVACTVDGDTLSCR